MARGAFRGAGVAWLALVTLQVVTSNGGSGKVAGAIGTLNDLIKRAISPDVALIPDHSKAASSSGSTVNGVDTSSPTALPQILAGMGAATATNARNTAGATAPGGLLGPNLTTYTNGAPPPKNAR